MSDSKPSLFDSLIKTSVFQKFIKIIYILYGLQILNTVLLLVFLVIYFWKMYKI